MYDTPQFEIPAAVRELAERNVNQVRQSYEQMLGLLHKAQDAVVKSQGAMAKSALEIQARSLEFAQANVMANFAFAADLARARDLKEYLEVQSRYAQTQLDAYAKQSQEITRLINEAAHKAQP
jgi:hypothetical protein